MKKVGGSFLMVNLILSIIAFGFIFNTEVVDARDPNLIYAGETLKLPDGSDYVVQSGDAMYKIAQAKGISTNELIAANPEFKQLLSTKEPGSTNLATNTLGKENLGVTPEYENPSIPESPTSESSKSLKESAMDYFFGKVKGGSYLQMIAQSAAWGIIAYTAAQWAGSFLGLDDSQIDAISSALGWGVAAGRGVYNLATSNNWNFGKNWFGGEGYEGLGWTTGIVVAAIIYYFTYAEESQEIISFECNPWDAPVGGHNCEKCNSQGDLPCSEYQCRSLGQACELINSGTEEEKCAWINKDDVEFPIITPWENALLDGYDYNPDNTISPPDSGVKIINTESTTGCVKAFTPLSFGITTNEPAKCRLDYLRKENFEDMQYYFGGSSLFKYNHTQVMSLPGPSALASENLTIENDGNYDLYVRCQDANGNYNTANFVFKFCVEQGPDTTPPLIVTTNLLNNMPIAYEQNSLDLEVYINEPAGCRWSTLDQSYDDMETSMSCSSSVLEMNAQMLYKCSTTLTGIKDREENKFYFRCKDSSDNKNAESSEFNVIGTQPLVIDSVDPNGTIRDSTEVVKVTLEAETSAGYKEGEATCYYSDTGEEGDYVMFYNTNSYIHFQELNLIEGNYLYYIKCVDLGGNSDIEELSFYVESDSSAPMITRIYHEETYLKLITNEEAECVYDTSSCSYLFDDGVKMQSTGEEKENHFTDWNIKTNYYIKCQDEYGNQPAPDECSIIARPFQIA